MNKEKITIWGRVFELEIRYDCYSGEEVLDSQIKALSSFISAGKSIDDSLEYVKEYCLAQNKEEIGADTIENIFKYVAPKYIYVQRSEDKRVAALMCNYKYDQENGIAVVFENERFRKIGRQDIIL